jgi:membrane dipeptidase
LNAKIQKSRDIALDVLKPSPADLEHGEALHRDALVFDAYGFMPCSSECDEEWRIFAESGASRTEIIDFLVQSMRTSCITSLREREEFKEAWEASGVTCVFQNSGEQTQSVPQQLKRLAHSTYVTDFLKNIVSRAATPDDIIMAKRENRHCLYLTTNAVPLMERWVSVEEELTFIRIFFQLGVRMMHLTYNRRNMIGEGCAESANGGLSDFGRTVVAEMNRVGVIVDVSHTGWQSSLEAARLSNRPMVASHSACASLNAHYRCKPDEVIRAIADTGGYIGITAVPEFLGRTGDLAAFLDHVDHAVKLVGEEHVAIGMDTMYQSEPIVQESTSMPKFSKGRSAFAALRRSCPSAQCLTWKDERMRESMAWTNWPLITVGLVQRGYTDDAIRKIVGGNALRVSRAVLPQMPCV